MQAKANSLGAGSPYEPDFIGAGEIMVRREGYSRANHLFIKEGRVIGRLSWRGMRRAVYESDGVRLEITVGPLGKRIYVVDRDGGESSLIERRQASPRRRRHLRIEAAEGDNFLLTRTVDGRLKSRASLTVCKEFYDSTLMVFKFETRRRTQTTFRVEITSTMKREARFGHRLLALVAARIILERRQSGSQPLRAKEEAGSAPRARVRVRFQS